MGQRRQDRRTGTGIIKNPHSNSNSRSRPGLRSALIVEPPARGSNPLHLLDTRDYHLATLGRLDSADDLGVEAGKNRFASQPLLVRQRVVCEATDLHVVAERII